MLGRDRRLIEFVCSLAGADDLDQFRHVVTFGVGTVVAADHVSYNEIDVRGGRVLALTDQPIDPIGAELEQFARLAHENPLITRRRQGPETISDYLSARRFHGLELYAEVYRQIGVEDQLAVALSEVGDPTLVGVALNRNRRGFAARDRSTVELLRPHLVRGYRRVLARERARAVLDQLQRTGADARVGVIALGPGGELDFVSDCARGWMRAYFPGELRASLPSPIERWLQGRADHDGLAPLTVSGDGCWLEVTSLVTGPREPRLLELRERRPSPAAALTPRESQILARVEVGQSNQDIARGLDISRSTVENHLRAVYRKLDVTNRTAAAARARATTSR